MAGKRDEGPGCWAWFGICFAVSCFLLLLFPSVRNFNKAPPPIPVTQPAPPEASLAKPPEPVRTAPTVAEMELMYLTWAPVKVTDYWYEDYGGLTVRGTITNKTKRFISYYRVTCEFYDKKDNMLDTKWTNDLVRIRPGGVSRWVLHADRPWKGRARVLARVTELRFED